MVVIGEVEIVSTNHVSHVQPELSCAGDKKNRLYPFYVSDKEANNFKKSKEKEGQEGPLTAGHV